MEPTVYPCCCKLPVVEFCVAPGRQCPQKPVCLTGSRSISVTLPFVSAFIHSQSAFAYAAALKARSPFRIPNRLRFLHFCVLRICFRAHRCAGFIASRRTKPFCAKSGSSSPSLNRSPKPVCPFVSGHTPCSVLSACHIAAIRSSLQEQQQSSVSRFPHRISRRISVSADCRRH